MLGAGQGRPSTLGPRPASWQVLVCMGCSSLLRGSRMISRLRDLPRVNATAGGGGQIGLHTTQTHTQASAAVSPCCPKIVALPL